MSSRPPSASSTKPLSPNLAMMVASIMGLGSMHPQVCGRGQIDPDHLGPTRQKRYVLGESGAPRALGQVGMDRVVGALERQLPASDATDETNDVQPVRGLNHGADLAGSQALQGCLEFKARHPRHDLPEVACH